MQKNGETYEYVAVNVDDLAIAMKYPKEFINILETVHGFKTNVS
jgi:hypothetical protein